MCIRDRANAPRNFLHGQRCGLQKLLGMANADLCQQPSGRTAQLLHHDTIELGAAESHEIRRFLYGYVPVKTPFQIPLRLFTILPRGPARNDRIVCGRNHADHAQKVAHCRYLCQRKRPAFPAHLLHRLPDQRGVIGRKNPVHIVQSRHPCQIFRLRSAIPHPCIVPRLLKGCLIVGLLSRQDQKALSGSYGAYAASTVELATA